ncbi:PAS domain S-box-containing protein/diguanylate cyclase (GGDEF) domain-containing protein/hemerythrin-like metal-binding domain protein [Trichlorobacter thiogenes]|uniref:PAS domain S-box-containing protein/diguanylate cyclase (GGDEF) domain-containing protein/hemerythrin-like metal-binding domain protein n=1 Tax=Trichlorobacter thiogenes TaxID=115783 RepID=A0A1T4L734_9BACT|nr:diguanylate cyclase [Trichlorobacter thiogenes]SJZ50407.1 PAS domain S-box-containing protein/diguanylate cyclase (GGDEF) domain-containing protein/hemerythrin-like metal-binding domain protein [Trichlorobacter thiogenes]
MPSASPETTHLLERVWRRLRPIIAACLFLTIAGAGISSSSTNQPPATPAPSSVSIPLSSAEKQYLAQLGPITVCPDPDWLPYEQMDAHGNFTGIAADLLNLISQRLGIKFTYVQVKDWDQAVALSQAGKVLLLPFLNQTPKRDQWLTFTEPLFSDPNVFITREEHPFITNASLLKDKTIAVPSGTSIEEKVRRDYPNLKILNTGNSEAEVFKAVAERRADLTLRSLTVSAYTIRKGGWFTLKIAGQAPDEYINRLRIGVIKSEPMLRDILNKGIATITPQEREEITNRHVNITVVKPMDYGFILRIAAALAALIGLSFYWNLRLKRINAALQESERSKSVLLANLPGMAYRCRFDRDWTMEFLSDGCLLLTGYHSDDLVQNKRLAFNDLIVPEYREQLWNSWQKAIQSRQPVRLEYRITTSDNKEKWVLEQGVPIFDSNGQVQALEGIIVDISELKQIEAQIQHLASYDNLTNLPNRALFSDRIDRALLSTQRHSSKLALFFVDLDQFKPINDELGHDVGDWVLQVAAQRMTESVRESDTVARIGGDEFAVLLQSITTWPDARNVAEKIRTALNRPFITPAGVTLTISCSIGVALYPDNGNTQRDLLHAADEAMYRAKKGGRNAVELCQPDLSQTGPVASHSIIRLVWKPDYLSGEPSIDAEHQELLRMANQLLELIATPQGDPIRFNTALDGLLQHITSHFEHEEALLHRIGYAELDEHARQHKQLKEQIIALRQVAEKKDISTAELVDFLAIRVVHEHLLEADRKYYKLLADRSSNSSTTQGVD